MRTFSYFLKRGIVGVCIVSCTMLYAHTALAASLLLSSASTNVVTGNIVTVRIAVDSGGQAINTAEGALQFPTNILQALSIDQSSSVFTIWAQNPSFSNDTGEVTFSGGLPTPGYSGSNGTVLTVSFLAKQTGAATLSLADADVRANDGLGTDVLQSTGTLQLTVVSAPAVQSAPTPVSAPTPAHVTAPTSAAPTEQASSPTTATTSIATTTLQAPLITNVTTDVPMGDVAEVTGTSIYPGATVELSLQEGSGQLFSSTSTVEQNGSFTITSMDPPPGQYIGTVMVQTDEGQSPPSSSFTINFEGVSTMNRLIGFLEQPVSLLVLGMIFAFILGLICGYGIFRARQHSPMRETLRDIDVEIHKEFLTLRSHINDSLHELERKSKMHRLTTDEKDFVSDMVGTIKDAEKEIEKDVRHPDA